MYSPDYVIDPRKLAAIHIATLGPPIAIGNFAGVALFCLSLGCLILRRADSCQMLAFGFYFVSISANYVVLLFFALEINNRERARSEIGGELNKQRGATGEFRRQSVYLLVPLVVPIVALQRHYKP